LLNRCRGLNPYPGFESLPHRQFSTRLDCSFLVPGAVSPTAPKSWKPRPARGGRRLLQQPNRGGPAPPGSGACSAGASPDPCTCPAPESPAPAPRASRGANRTSGRQDLDAAESRLRLLGQAGPPRRRQTSRQRHMAQSTSLERRHVIVPVGPADADLPVGEIHVGPLERFQWWNGVDLVGVRRMHSR
jgi:hypothetical protein